MNKKPMSPATKGLIISAFLILFSVVISVFKYDQKPILGLAPILIMIGGIVWACNSYSKDMYGNVTFGNIFVHGFKTSALIAGIMALFVLLSLTVLFPETLDRAMETARVQMSADKNMSAQQIEKNMRIGRKAAVIAGPPFTGLFYLIGGAICAVIGAAVSKKNPNAVPFDQIDQPVS